MVDVLDVLDVLGALAFFVVAISFLFRDDTMLRRLNIAGCVLWALHFLFIQAWFACFMLCLAIAMITSGVLGKTKLTRAFWGLNLILIPFVALLALFDVTPWASLFPVVGGFLINTGIVMFSSHTMSAFVFSGEAFWVITGLLYGSPYVVLANLTNITALGVRTVRIVLKERRSKVPAVGFGPAKKAE